MYCICICTSESFRYFKFFYGKSVATILTVGKEHMTEKVWHMIGLLYQPKRKK